MLSIRPRAVCSARWETSAPAQPICGLRLPPVSEILAAAKLGWPPPKRGAGPALGGGKAQVRASHGGTKGSRPSLLPWPACSTVGLGPLWSQVAAEERSWLPTSRGPGWGMPRGGRLRFYAALVVKVGRDADRQHGGSVAGWVHQHQPVHNAGRAVTVLSFPWAGRREAPAPNTCVGIWADADPYVGSPFRPGHSAAHVPRCRPLQPAWGVRGLCAQVGAQTLVGNKTSLAKG